MKPFRPVKLFALLLFIGICAFIALFFVQEDFFAIKQNKIQANQQLEMKGRIPFESYCAACHGPDGSGHGPSSITLSKLPPDFLSENTYFMNGFNTEGLNKTINEGIANSQMPKFDYLPTDVKKDLIEYLIYLREKKN